MSLIAPPFATTFDLAVLAGASVSAFSQGSYSVLVSNNLNANIPPVWSVLAQVPAGAATFTSAVFPLGALIRIDASGGSPVSVDVGLSPGPKLERAATIQGATVTAFNATASLTNAQIAGGIITSTTVAAVVATLPTGAALDAQGVQGINEGVIWSVVNTGGVNAFTVTSPGASHLVTGSGIVALGTSGRFVTLKAGVALYNTYRI